MPVPADRSVLVTGASGFMGGHLVRRLIECGCRVSCLVRASRGLNDLPLEGLRLFVGDVTNPGSVAHALAESRADAVFHLAGLVRADRREYFMRVNAGGVETVAAACAARPTPPTLVVVSSLAAAGPAGSAAPRTESDLPEPVSHYGRSKLAGERAAARYAQVMPISIVRPPIVFGSHDRGLLELFRPIARWGLHIVPGRGDARVSLIHVDDLVEGLLLVAANGERLQERATPGQGIYFISGDERPTFVELGQAIATALGRERLRTLGMPGPLLRLLGRGGDAVAWIRRRPGWICSDKIAEALAGSWTCSPAKARAHLGWPGAAVLSDRLRETAEWYRRAGWI